ncbi:hypothetical protein [Catenuloplanes japonicus]|uniref:hypothetical protein n=1 Tax=Catenuloplanes japonicus TaxID=33876 RepID=UPI0012FB6C4F|nr:hypothetical protein [Catenuloplanes japonicus]
MRAVGAAVAGMFAGLLLGVLLTDPAARLLGTGNALFTFAATAPPLLALTGAAVGVLIERRSR